MKSMNKGSKRFLGLLIVLCMILTLFGCSAGESEGSKGSGSAIESSDQSGIDASAESTGEEQGPQTGEETDDMDVKTEDIPEFPQNSSRENANLVMAVNEKVFYPELEENSSADAFFEKLSSESLEVELHDYGGFEKVGPLPWELPRNDEEITTVPGDIILYEGDQISVYYDENTWNFTRLARIRYVTKEELLEALGEGDAVVSFWLEWNE